MRVNLNAESLGTNCYSLRVRPAGYMAKFVEKRPSKSIDWLSKLDIHDIYSVSNCISNDFADYIKQWKHNGYWLFDSPTVIREVARDEAVDLKNATLFYYEIHELQINARKWMPWNPEPSFTTHVEAPADKQLTGFDVVTFYAQTSPECSPLSCNGLAKELPVNEHCLFDTFDEAERYLNEGAFKDCEPGPYRIFAVYTVNRP
jgi:hypothetical protein